MELKGGLAHRITVVLPTYNERETLPLTVEKLSALLGRNVRFIVVDDNSPDGTAGVAIKLSEKYPIKLILREKREGLGAALMQAYKEVETDLILSIDTDMQFSLDNIKTMFERIDEGCDIVVASRYVRGGSVHRIPILRILASRTANALARAICRVPISDFTANFRLFKRDVLARFSCTRKSNFYLAEFLVKAHRSGLKICEVPVEFHGREKGKSKLRLFKESLLFVKELITLSLTGL